MVVEDHAPAADLDAAFVAAGLERWLYVHDATARWPTLGALVEADTRLVVGAESAGPPPAWLHHAWDVMWDTPYSFERPEDFSCACSRGCPSRQGQLFLVNHWLSTPLAAPEQAAATNAYDRLYGRAATCRDDSGFQPTLLAVDFYDVGDLFAVVDALNGIAAEAR